MATAIRLSLLLVSFSVLWLASTWAIAADCCCSHCGCRETKKMTRLVTSFEEIEIPLYQCTTAKSFRPKKGIVCHSGYRCDKYYKLHAKWCCQEHCVSHEHCEDVTHYVDKNPCDSECECHTEHHHEKHFDYRLTCRNCSCMSCQVDRSFKTLYAACPNGYCTRVCTKQPTGEVCTSVVPVVRWVTFRVCPRCDHHWSADRTAFR